LYSRVLEYFLPRRDIVVVGASSGGVEALMRLAAGLPADLPGALFMVVHFLPMAPSILPRILDRSGPLEAIECEDGALVRSGRIYVACPDRHLLVEEGRVRLVPGPKENRHRPAVDTLFRSAAIAYGPRVTGVVLTGALDDGTGGSLL
jgi:two-component system chemotaxis response regulator CheB